MKKNKEFAVLGLGKFGMSLAKCLAESGCEVMAVDLDRKMVSEAAEYATYAEVGDVTDKEFIDTLGLSNYDGTVIGIGDNIEASVMAAIIAKEAGAKYVLAKAGGDLHAKILRKVGADKVIYPEYDAGMRTANQLVHGNYFDATSLSSTYSIMEIDAPEKWEGCSLRSLDLRAKYKINVIGIMREDDMFVNPDADMPICCDDVLVVLGENDVLVKLVNMKEETSDDRKHK